MQKSLFQKNRHLKTFFNSIPSATYIVDHNLTVFDLNKVASNMLGQNTETRLMSRYGEMIQCFNDSRSVKGCGNTMFCDECVIRESVKRAREENRTVSQDFVLKMINSDKIEKTDMKIIASPFEMENEHYVILTLEKSRPLVNKSEKPNRLHLTLQESEARFKDIANNVQEWIWEVDAGGKYTYSSPVVKKIIGYDPEDVLGKNFYDFFHPDEKKRLKELAFRTFEHKRSFSKFINRNIHKNGDMVVLSTSGVPVFDEFGALIGYRGADTDITDQYIAEEALRESEGHLRSLMDSAEGFATGKQNAYITLKAYKKELETRTAELEQMNTALNVLLSKREQDKSKLEDRINDNIEKLILPYLARIRRRNLKGEQSELLDIIESNLHNITAGFSSQLTSRHIGLTPTEIRIADLVRQGQKTKKIAHLLFISPKTVESHRERIRMKLGIKNSKINLHSYLLTMK